MSTHNTTAIKPPKISLPKGGGAIRGLGETFQPDSFSGAGSYSIPFDITSARNLTPQITLSYNSGSGNSPFGIGFNVGLPKITTKTETGIPKYEGTNIFLFQGQELVVKKQTTIQDSDWLIIEYYTRKEADFSKIEQHLKTDRSESFWRVTNNVNTVSTYGTSSESRIANPKQTYQIFEWLIDETIDTKGNSIKYNYKGENNQGIGNNLWEQNRLFNNRYISIIQYGNYVDANGDEQYAFDVKFDYGEYDITELENGNKTPYLPTKDWAYRKDPFSTFISGFEIRTCRICQNILLFHHFKNELGDPRLVKQLALIYHEPKQYGDTGINGLSSLNEVTLIGYNRIGKNATDPYVLKKSPTTHLQFSKFNPPQNPIFSPLNIQGETIPNDLSVGGFQPIDLNQEGLPGLLYNNGNALLYSQPLGSGNYANLNTVSEFPINHSDNSQFTLVDIESKGNLDLVVKSERKAGFYEKAENGNWKNFMPFSAYPTNAESATIEQAGLSNTGYSDLFIAQENNLLLFQSKGKKGFSNPTKVPLPNGFPLIKHNYKKEYVGFANLFGDGLSHRIKISNGKVSCWPDLGYGRFGEEITLGNAPVFENNFDISRLFLADIDGSGTIDIAYAYSNRVDIFLNNNGNFFSDPITIPLPDTFTTIDHLSFADVLGNGTTCLLFTKSGSVMQHYYYNFIGALYENDSKTTSLKPYLLNTIENSLGGLTRITYCSSVKFYLEDKANGREWPHRLSFPVQLVEKINITDQITKSHYTKSFKYHDGYYDRTERKFRGFGMVETWDTESYQEFIKSNPTLPNENYVPPVYTKTWYNTGAYNFGPALNQRNTHFFNGDKAALKFPNSELEPCIYEQDSETIRQAYAALAGTVLRTEVYGLDTQTNPKLVDNPYSVAESSMAVKLIQKKGDQPYAVFLVIPKEGIQYTYERNPEDPQINQSFTTEVDRFGNICQSIKVSLPRRNNTEEFSPIYPEQQVLKAVVSLNKFVNPIDGYYFNHETCENQSLELLGLDLNGQDYFDFNTIKSQGSKALQTIVKYGEVPPIPVLCAQQIDWTRTFFWNKDQTEMADFGIIFAQGLIHHHESAVLTESLSISAFNERIIDKTCYNKSEFNQSILYTKGGFFYDTDSNYWWNKGLVQYYYDSTQLNAFFLPIKAENTFAFESQNTPDKQDVSLCLKTSVTYDPYFFTPITTSQFLNETSQNTTTAIIDYNFFELKEISDINKNVAQALFDPLGQVIVTSLFGKERGVMTGGMTLYAKDGVDATYKLPGSINFNDVIAHPEQFLQGASTFFYYDFEAWKNEQSPSNTIQLVRQHFWQDAHQTDSPYCHTGIEFSDGLGRVIETKMAAEPTKEVPSRWRVSGRKVYNNKGKIFEEYLPYFSNQPIYEPQTTLQSPPPTVTHYDALSRTIRVDSPKGFFTATKFTPWQQINFDHNDTIFESKYYQNLYPGTLNQEAQDAIKKAEKAYQTPDIKIHDNTGNLIRHIQNNLGNVYPALFKTIIKGTSITEQDIIEGLHAAGYLLKEEKTIKNTIGTEVRTFYWVTSKFTAYSKGFSLDLPAEFRPLIPQIIQVLKQNQLTTYLENDISGRHILNLDPRLYYSNIQNNHPNFNFQMSYEMGEKKPMVTQSCDAGTQYILRNIFGHSFWTWNSRQYCQLTNYDTLQRKSELYSKKITTPGLIKNDTDFNLIEAYTYGELVPQSTDLNLRGQLYQLNDLSGIAINHEYNIQAQVVYNTKQVVSNYKIPANWNASPELAPTIYPTYFTYNAMRNLTSQTTPDQSIIQNTYGIGGFLKTVNLTLQDQTDHTPIESIDYNANGQRLTIQYGNGIKTNYKYEATTLLLTAIKSYKLTTGTSYQIAQDLEYYYDPMANITQSKNNTIDIVFNKNQQVKPLLSYDYDALYRLTSATGRQHKGISANTYKNNTADASFMQCIYGPKPSTESAGELENYSTSFLYDDSGNLTKKQHTASTSWTRNLPVNLDSNRLTDLTYDKSGNLTQLDINNSVKLSFNGSENLVKAAVIERPGELDDADYYVYNNNAVRTLKVSERYAHGATTSLIDRKTYLGNYEILQTYQGHIIDPSNLKSECQTLRIMDGQTCVLIINYTAIDKQKVKNEGLRKFRFQMDNHIESISLEMDEKANLITYEEYFPYGGTAIITGENQSEVKLKTYRYSGKERDNSTGLYYYGLRYYAPWMGRWLKPDPAGTIDGLNLYCFVGGNPIKYKDHRGATKSSAKGKGKGGKKKVASGGVKKNKVRIPFPWRYRAKGTDAMRTALDHHGLFILDTESIHSSVNEMAVMSMVIRRAKFAQLTKGSKRKVGQSAVMGGLSPNESAKELGLSMPNSRSWEWLHLVAFSLKPTHADELGKESRTLMKKTGQPQQIRENLVLGTAASNTNMLTYESAIKQVMREHPHLELDLSVSPSYEEKTLDSGKSLRLASRIRYHFQFRDPGSGSISEPIMIDFNTRSHVAHTHEEFENEYLRIKAKAASLVKVPEMPIGIRTSHMTAL